MKMLEESDDDPETPPEDVKINSATIEEIPDPVPSGKGKGSPKLDFPLGLYSIMSVIYSQRRDVYPQLARKRRK